MAAVNPERGEVEIMLSGKGYPMRPSFDAVLAIERELDEGLLMLVQKAVARQIKLSDMAVIVTQGIRAAGKDRNDPMLQAVTTAVVGEKIYEGGLIEATAAVAVFLQNALMGGSRPSKKSEAESPPPVSSTGA